MISDRSNTIEVITHAIFFLPRYMADEIYSTKHFITQYF